jgi:hypothetical protein
MNENRAKKVAAQLALGKWDFVLQRGMFGFGIGFALISIMWEVYKGEPLIWDRVKFEVALKVFVAGPIWGFFMWKWTQWMYKDQVEPQASGGSDSL